MTDERTGQEKKKDFSKSGTFLFLIFIWLVLASPMPPFDILPKTPLSILIPQLLAFCVLASGVVIGSWLKRPLIQFVSIVGLLLCLWQLPSLDASYVVTQEWRLLSNQGIAAQASIINSKWRQPQAIFWLFSGGGGHPTHIFDLELRFSTNDGMEQRVSTSEYYPPAWHVSLTELESAFRKGNVIPVRYLAADPSLVGTQKYLDSFRSSAVSNPFVAIIAPWVFAAPILLGLVFSRKRKT
jgi:hypothetical protein